MPNLTAYERNTQPSSEAAVVWIIDARPTVRQFERWIRSPSLIVVHGNREPLPESRAKVQPSEGEAHPASLTLEDSVKTFSFRVEPENRETVLFDLERTV